MVNYTCPRCNYTTSQKCDIKKHFKRKRLCKAINKDISYNECEKIVLGKKTETIYKKLWTKEEVDEIVKNEIIKEREKHEYIIRELKSQIRILIRNQGSNNTYTTNVNIVVNSFGKENLEYISGDFISNLIESGPLDSISQLIQYIHFNPEHQENHNVKIPIKSNNYAQIFNGDDWEYRDRKSTIKHMSDKAFSILNDHYLEGSNKYMDNFKKKYRVKDKDLCKRLEKDTEMMILNNQIL